MSVTARMTERQWTAFASPITTSEAFTENAWSFRHGHQHPAKPAPTREGHLRTRNPPPAWSVASTFSVAITSFRAPKAAQTTPSRFGRDYWPQDQP
jgi:hypothetical protein